MSVDGRQSCHHRQCKSVCRCSWISISILLDLFAVNIRFRVGGFACASCKFLNHILKFRSSFVIHLCIHKYEWIKACDIPRTIKTSFKKRKLVTHVTLFMHYEKFILHYFLILYRLRVITASHQRI